MGEIGKPDNAEDQRETDCTQGNNAPKDNSVYDELEQCSPPKIQPSNLLIGK